jgi:hypothetical protein
VFVVPVPAILRRVVVCGRAKDGEFGSGSEDVGGVFAPGGEGAVEGVDGAEMVRRFRDGVTSNFDSEEGGSWRGA